MNILPKSELCKLPKNQWLELAPIKILWDGEEIGYFCQLDDVLVIGDLHPAVRNQLRARAKLARSAQGKPDVRVDYLPKDDTPRAETSNVVETTALAV